MRSRRGGFTLIEVLISLFIMALMAAMSWQGVDMVMRTRDTAQHRLDDLLRMQSVLAQWEIDLRSIDLNAPVPNLSFDGAHLRLIRHQPDGIQVVVWSVQKGELLRWSAPPTTQANTLQEHWFRSQQLRGNEPGTLHALSGIASWQLQYFYGISNAWSNAQSTGEAEGTDGAASGTRPALPDGVRLILLLSPTSGRSGSITRDIRLIHP
ncbi:MAG: type II secretion system protein J [Leptothrix ochracea]|uniref:PulJ/GspJ family protein n=1 Tax=Leptothrix ochracea TaxID=735331 RepID=UPI0034E2C3A0